jgi:hypothetical protein
LRARHDAGRPAEPRRRLLPDAAGRMRLHFVVRAVEAWLLADAESMARFLSVTRAGFPEVPESLPDPKAALLELARRSRRREIRAGMIPAPGTTARIGPGYTALLIDYTAHHWRPRVAAGGARASRA